MSDDVLKWATELAERKAVVINKEHRRAGQIVGLLVENAARDDEGQPVARHDPIFQMASGDTFWAVPKNFIVLDEKETKLFEAATSVIASVLAEMKTLVVSLQIKPFNALVILGSVLRLQSDLILKTDEQETF